MYHLSYYLKAKLMNNRKVCSFWSCVELTWCFSYTMAPGINVFCVSFSGHGFYDDATIYNYMFPVKLNKDYLACISYPINFLLL